jgi:hypothetical protein
MSRLFEFLFKYPRFVFDQADFAFAASRSTSMMLAALAIIALGALITYRGITTEGALKDRLILVAARLGVVAVMLFCLFRPSLILKTAVPQQNPRPDSDSRSRRLPTAARRARVREVAVD